MNINLKILRLFSHRLGIDKAIAYSSGARIIQIFTGAISVIFIATFLTSEEQGFYYTFSSIIAIQVFFELGFTGIITQYVAHEAVHLTLTKDNIFEGEEKYKSRLSYLISFCIKWYLIISVAFFVVVNFVGYAFFTSYDKSDSAISWKIPWLILSFSTAIKLFQSPFTSILTGLGKVKEMNEIGFYQQLILPISMWLCLACGLKLYVVGISSLLSVVIWIFYVYKTNLGSILYILWKNPIFEKINYFKEIFPYQWKIALSWVSGFFIFQLFNPVLFATEGAIVAGQMGMTISVLNAIQSFALSWQNTKVPLYCGLIELKKYDELDRIFNKTLKQMSSICLFILISMFLCIWGFRSFNIKLGGNLLGDRFLDYIPMILLMIPLFANQFVNSWATYLRCHKQEPFLALSVTMGVLCCLSTFLLGNKFGLYGITIGYCFLITFVSLPWAFYTFITKKHEWHYVPIKVIKNE